MRRIILDEKGFIESALEGKADLTGIPMGKFMQLLAEYNMHVLKMGTRDNMDCIITTVPLFYPDFRLTKHSQAVDYCIQRAKWSELSEIKGIPVTEAEYAKVLGLGSSPAERLMFTMLVYAKYWDLMNPANNGWANMDLEDLWACAHLSGSVESNCAVDKKLLDAGYIGFTRNSRSDNVQVKIIDKEEGSPVAMEVTDLRELGYQYLRKKGRKHDGIFRTCKGCGVCFKAKKPNQLYCKECLSSEGPSFKARQCIDCGRTFYPEKFSRTERCPECRDKRSKEMAAARLKRFRERQKTVSQEKSEAVLPLS